MEDPHDDDALTKSIQDISVIICAFSADRWNELVAAVDSAKSQTLRPREIIVVIDHNRKLFKVAQSNLAGVTVIENNDMKGASGARNSGVSFAKGNVVAFIDDDAEASPDWLEQLYMGYQHTEVLGVGGKIEPRWLKTQPKWFPEEFNWVIGATYKGYPETTAPVRNLWTGNMSVRREVFVEIQGFRTGFGKVGNHSSPEDTDFCIRALQHRPQWVWLYKPEAKVQHRVPASRACWKYFLSRCFNEGLGKAKLSILVGSEKGISAERSHMFNVLPRGVSKSLADTLFRHDLSGFGRAGAILLGLAVTVAGFLVGTITENILLPKPTTDSPGEDSKKDDIYADPCR